MIVHDGIMLGLLKYSQCIWKSGSTKINDWILDYFSGPVNEFVLILIFLCMLTLYRLAISKVSRWVAKTRYNIESEHILKKIASNTWYGVYYLWAAISGICLITIITGWYNESNICTHENSMIALRLYPGLMAYYIAQVAFYINYILAMATSIDVRRKDWKAFALHHLITISLIVYSRNNGYMRVMLAVFAIHDAADPFLHIAKVLKYTGAPEMHSNIVFGLFVVVFFISRLFLYPMWIIEHCRMGAIFPMGSTFMISAQSDLLIPQFGFWSDHLVLGGAKLFYYDLSMGMIYILFFLHLYWGAYILKMITRKFVDGKQEEDTNSDDEEDDDDDEINKKNR